MSQFWDAKTYSRFLELRTRPARDLLAGINESFQPQIIYDLGCGPGNSTILLKNRWPQAKVVGVDYSADMLKEARAAYPGMTFIEGDIAKFSPVEKIDCLFANASLQWLDHHEILFPYLLKFLNPGGVLAVQMPNNFHLPSHQIIIELLKSKKEWQPFLKKLIYGALNEPRYRLSNYYDLLAKNKAKNIQLWQTEYYQELPDHQAIVDWVKGTGLSPVFSAMNENQKAQFSQEYLSAISTAYVLQANGKVLLPYQRIFMIGLV